MASMSPAEAASYAYQAAHIDENIGSQIIAVSSVFTGLALLCCCLRIAARRVGRVPFGIDDYLAVAATVSLLSQRRPIIRIVIRL